MGGWRGCKGGVYLVTRFFFEDIEAMNQSMNQSQPSKFQEVGILRPNPIPIRKLIYLSYTHLLPRTYHPNSYHNISVILLSLSHPIPPIPSYDAARMVHQCSCANSKPLIDRLFTSDFVLTASAANSFAPIPAPSSGVSPSTGSFVRFALIHSSCCQTGLLACVLDAGNAGKRRERITVIHHTPYKCPSQHKQISTCQWVNVLGAKGEGGAVR